MRGQGSANSKRAPSLTPGGTATRYCPRGVWTVIRSPGLAPTGTATLRLLTGVATGTATLDARTACCSVAAALCASACVWATA